MSMKTTTRRQRALRKLILPLIALAMMTTMMAMQSQAGASHGLASGK
jgi:hypothetical protein